MKWDQLGVTNVLLLVIAVLMLVMVAQQPRNYAPAHAPAPNLSEMGAAPTPGQGMNPHAVNPHGEMADGPQAATESDFNFQNMIYAALICPGDPTITLADFGCESAQATERREYVTNIYNQGLAPRQLFDEIINTFGVEALTDEAQEIRRNNRAGQ